MAGKITGVLGDAVAKLTFDEEFQDKRHKDSFSHGLEGAARVGECFYLAVIQAFSYCCTKYFPR